MRKVSWPLLVVVDSSLGAAGRRRVRRDRAASTVGNDYFFRPGHAPTVAVHRARRVKWNWRGRRRHNVTVTAARCASTRGRSPGHATRQPFTADGHYQIVCTIHPGMEMKVARQVAAPSGRSETRRRVGCPASSQPSGVPPAEAVVGRRRPAGTQPLERRPARSVTNARPRVAVLP